MSKQTIGDFLATLRREKGYTQQEVADNLSVSNRTVSAWERGSALPDILLLPAIAELYGVTTDEILSGERSAGERAALPQISEKNESKLLQNKLAKFTTQACILTGIFCLGLNLFFFGWLARVIFHGYGWLILLWIGVAAMIACAVTLVLLLLHTEKKDKGKENFAVFRILLRRRFLQCACIGAALSFLFAFHGILYMAVVRNKDLVKNVLFNMCFLLLAVFFLISGLAPYSRALTKCEGGEVNVNNNGKLLRKVFRFGLIPLAVAVAFVVVFSAWNPVMTSWSYENENIGEFTAHMETLRWGKYQYKLEISGVSKNAQDGVEYDLGNGFTARFYSYRTVCAIYYNPKGAEQYVVATVRQIKSTDGSYSVFNVYYRDEVVDSGDSIIASRFELIRGDAGATYCLKNVHDFSAYSVLGAFLLVAVDFGVSAGIFLAKRKRISIKL